MPGSSETTDLLSLALSSKGGEGNLLEHMQQNLRVPEARGIELQL
jgi:hypothetical protein